MADQDNQDKDYGERGPLLVPEPEDVTVLDSDGYEIGPDPDEPQPTAIQRPPTPREIAADAITNPQRLQEKFELSDRQALNVASTINGVVCAASRKYLTKPFGGEIAGTIGGLLGGIISKKVVGK